MLMGDNVWSCRNRSATLLLVIADATANTYTTRLCKHVRHANAVQNCINKSPVADLYRWSWGGGGFLKVHWTARANDDQIFEG